MAAWYYIAGVVTEIMMPIKPKIFAAWIITDSVG
jgi:hypothetical protein